jgi:hypothetical protein
MSNDKIYLNAAKLISEKYFNFNSKVKVLRSGTRGSAFLVDNDTKVLKITDDVDEALRAEKIKGKNFSNLITYHSIRKIKSSNYLLNGKYCLLMDKLPMVLTDDENIENIFRRYESKYGIAFNNNNMPGYDIKNPVLLKNFIQKNLSEMEFYFKLDRKYKEIAERMWFDLIKIRRQLRKCGIVTNDITIGNLGFDDMGNLIFFDMGYPGAGGKRLKKGTQVQVQFEPKLEKPKSFIKKLKPKVVENFNNFVVFESIEVEI